MLTADTPVQPVPAAPVDAGLAAKTAALSAQMDAGFTRFTQAEQSATTAVAAARGAVQGSDSWVTAETALAGLDDARAALFSTLADLETLAMDRGVAGKAPVPVLDQAIAAARLKAEDAERRSSVLEVMLADQSGRSGK